MSHTQQHQQQKRQSKTTAKKPNKENDALLSDLRLHQIIQQQQQQQQSQSFEKQEQAAKKTGNQPQQRRGKQDLQNMILYNQEASINKSSSEIIQQRPQQKVFQYQLQSDSVNTTNFQHQASMSHSFSLKNEVLLMSDGNNSLNAGRLENLDSNGNAIRGRKLDSPQLVVVKELRDQEDQEEATMENLLLSNNAFGTNRAQDDIVLLWNVRDKSNSENKRRNAGQRGPGTKESKSLENKNKGGKTVNRDGKNRILYKEQATKQEKGLRSIDNSNLLGRGVKSTRDVRSSMGFHELLNQLDKDMSIQQQSNQFDFKNRTAHDLLRLELSAIRKQNSSNFGGLIGVQNNATGARGEAALSKSQERVKSRTIHVKQQTTSGQNKIKGTVTLEPKSKSLERKQASSKAKAPQAVMPKSIMKKNQEQGVKELLVIKNRLINMDDVTPDKNSNHQGINATSFLHSEHGRCQTSQGVQQNQSTSLQNGRTNSHQNILSASSNMNVIFNKIKNSLTQQIHQVNSSQGASRPHKDQISPERATREAKLNSGNIDKLIRENIKKVRTKEEEEKLLKLQADETQKKKRDWIEYKNNLVRKINKEKIYKKQLLQQQVNTFQANQLALTQFNDQQAQDDSIDQRQPPQLIDEQMSQINRNILKREKFMQKSSQSQKIDFENIKEGGGASKENNISKKISLKNHRKSYGLEFIDIKREIQEELRTIDLKFKNRELLLPDMSSSNIKTLDNTQKPRRLKIKSQGLKQTPKPDETLPFSMVSNGEQHPVYGSERMQPISKVIVVKKSKIRKFMKQKKKTFIFKQLQEQKEQILKIIKMQENQSKLNDYCKRNLEKHVQKRRNATMQEPQRHLSEGDIDLNGGISSAADQSKISGRRIIFDNIEKQKHIYEVMREEHLLKREREGLENDSSMLSTDFYEEYFRLINSIKKEQQATDNQQHSRVDISSQNITSKSLQNLLKSPVNNSQSPTGNIQTTQISAFSPKQGDNSSQSQNTQQKLKKKTKSKSNLKHVDSQLLHHTNQKAQSSININQKMQSISKQTIKTAATADVSKINMRAESAPLLLHQSMKKRQGGKGGSPQRRHSPTREDNLIKKDKAKKSTKKKQSGHEFSETLAISGAPLSLKLDTGSKSSKKDKSRSKSEQQHQNFDADEQALLMYFLKCVLRIQRSFRAYLQERGFYDSYVNYQDELQQSAQLQHSSEKEYQTQIFNGGDNNIFDHEGLGESPLRDADESDYDGEEELNNGVDSNMIIIDEKSNDEKQKKVVYLSNINSCSLPQSPKGENNQSSNQYQLDKGQEVASVTSAAVQNAGKKLKEVFEYKPGMMLVQPNKFFSQSLSASDQIHQQISQKPSIESNLNSDSGMLNQVIDKQSKASSKQGLHLEELIEETKEIEQAVVKEQPTDYQMRLFTGSESLLREFKHSTPKQVTTKKEEFELHKRQNKNEVEESKSNATNSRNSQAAGVDQLSHSSNSVFDRNSFQQYTMQKLQSMMKNNDYMNLIEMREKALEYRKSKEKKFIRKMFQDRQFSPRTYTQRKQSLEKWVSLERKEIQRTKHQFEAEWKKTVKMIEDTQKNVDQMRVKIDNRLGGERSQSQSSRNSAASYVTSRHQDKAQRKGIFEQEEYQPMSQRSMRLSISSQITIEHNKSVNQQLQNHSQLSHQPEREPKKQDSDLAQVPSSDNQRDNLMDFLEKSWQKNQPKKDKPQGIHIEDQKQALQQERQPFARAVLDSYSPLDSEEILNEHVSEQSFAELPPSSLNQFVPTAFEDQKKRDPRNREIDIELVDKQTPKANERSLLRSRSEQDLSELIRNNIINFNDDNDISEHNQQYINEDKEIFVLSKNQFQGAANEIKIQENLFDESSQRFSKQGRSHLNRDSSAGGRGGLHSDIDEDSLLNESELNNYFQDQKFSIEDFKSLDKRKIMQGTASAIADPLAAASADAYDEMPDREGAQQEILAKSHHQAQIIRDQLIDESFGPGDLGQLREGRASREFSAQEMRDDEEPSFSMIQRPGDSVPRTITPDHIPLTAFSQHQQTFLFQSSRPGENIKISDILKKTQNLTIDAVPSSFLTPDSSAAGVFSNQHINQSMVIPTLQPLTTGQEIKFQVDALTEEILAQLLVSELTVPKRNLSDLETQLSQADQSQQHHLQEQVLKVEPEAQPVADVFVIDAQQSEKEMRRELIDYRQRMVMEQDLIRVENYINEVIHALQQSELQYLTLLANNVDPSTPEMQSNYHRIFLNVLTQPIKKQELETLNQLQTSEIGSYDHFETAQDLNTNPILPIDLYLEIERQREESQLRMLYINGQQELELENSIVQESSHIHNKGVFDSLNESLMKFRPYGITGEPMPWSNKNRRLQTKVDTNSVDTERLFMMVKQDVLRWVQVFSGCQPSPIFICKRQENSETEVFDEELFQETRERRLAQMLASDVVENEHQWLNYEFEEAQVKIDLSDMILEHLVEEATLFLNFKQDQILRQREQTH